MLVVTKKTKLQGLNPRSEYEHYIVMTDGKHAATFFDDGESCITESTHFNYQNIFGTRFTGDFYDFERLPGWGRTKNLKAQIEEMKDFLDFCYSVVINFADSGELAYMA